VQPAHHGTDRDLEDVGDLLVAESLDIGEQDGHAELLRQGLDGLLDLVIRVDVEQLVLGAAPGGGGLEAAAAGRSAEDELMDWFTDAEVKEAVEDLPEQFRMAVLLADVEGFSYKEIADILEIPIGTVMSRLHRARRILKTELAEEVVK